MQPTRSQLQPETRSEQAALNSRLERVAWGLFLIVLGGLAFIPNELVPDGAWLIAAGLIMLGLNAARYALHLKISGFTVVLGLIALASGSGDIIGVDLPVFPILLILVGLFLILRPFIERNVE